MNWTREKPTKEGLYWSYDPEGRDTIVVRVQRDEWHPGRFDYQEFGTDDCYDSGEAKTGGWWWLGPLDVPKSPHMVPATEVA